MTEPDRPTHDVPPTDATAGDAAPTADGTGPADVAAAAADLAAAPTDGAASARVAEAAVLPPAAAAPAGPTPAPPVQPSSADAAELGRRRFFRQFATDMVHTAVQVVGAATALQRSSMDAASALLNPGDVGTDSPLGSVVAGLRRTGPSSGTAPGAGPDAAATRATYRSAFRVEGERIVLVDQRRLPFRVVEVECRTAADVATELAAGAIATGPAMGQVAALGLAFSASRVRASQPYARRAILRAAETTLLNARPTSRPLAAAVERVMARYRAVGELEEDGGRIADALQAEADAIAFEATDDHGRIAEAAAPRIPARTDRPTGVLTLGSTGAMGGGQFGTALGAIQAAIYAARDVHVYVLEGRPMLDGARITSWELTEAGIAHTLLPDSAAGWLLASGRVDVVLVGADAIARNGDLANDTGTYPLAVLAARHDVPFIVCAPLAALDPQAADGRALKHADRPAIEVIELSRQPIALVDTAAMSPVVDVTPAGLVSAIATEEGLVEAPFEAGLSAALASRARRLPSSLAGLAVVGLDKERPSAMMDA